MTTLISISPPDPRIDSAGLELHRVRTLPIVVISPHNQCDCHCVMCDIWKIRDAEEFSVPELERQIASFRDLRVRWVVFTGGEPQKNSRFSTLASMLRDEGIRVTLQAESLLPTRHRSFGPGHGFELHLISCSRRQFHGF